LEQIPVFETRATLRSDFLWADFLDKTSQVKEERDDRNNFTVNFLFANLVELFYKFKILCKFIFVISL